VRGGPLRIISAMSRIAPPANDTANATVEATFEATSAPDPHSCYLALKARDARFDGRFFTGVTSTGIYCRPVCAVRTPKAQNCRFFVHAAQAEQAGFRPCLRCRPELAPFTLAWSHQDAGAILSQQALRLLDAPEAWCPPTAPMAALAAKLGVSERHVRRIFEAQLGVSPQQYLQTRRLLTAKQLLADTCLPVADVALASGFASVRRFNAAFAAHYRLNPTQMRRAASPAGAQAITVRLSYRPPLDVAHLLGFLRTRALDAIECIADDAHPMRASRTFCIQSGGKTLTGWLQAEFDPLRHQVLLQVSDSLLGVLPLVLRRVRAWLDLDADPQAINAVLGDAFAPSQGIRVPGGVDGFELAVRAVLGQQVTVAAGRTLAQRLVNTFGAAIDTPHPQLSRLFPAAQVLAQASGDALGQLGIVKTRQAAIVALAQGVVSGRLPLDGAADVPATVAALKALPGIGDWTAQYIAMRALRWPDAFPSADVALHKALGVQGRKTAARDCEAQSQAWRPWRSYAVIRAWASLNSVPLIATN
jgi:AraC family transcriptional regulator, regulatory protein of adaptative response / DNA-3-methyladenine glycosylase II